MLERVAQTIRRYRMFDPGQRVGVAVSGGADSVCLLHVLSRLGPQWDLRLTVLHFNHRLRGEESEADAAFVAELARRLDLPFRLQVADVRALARRAGENLEQAARKARREFFLDLLTRGELDRVALGHTRSDQAETVLFRLLRGSGITGLAAMRAVTGEGFVRPLLEVSRAQVEDYLTQQGLEWRLDSSNLDMSLARNRIRRELLPRLAREFNPGLEEALAQTATLAGDEEDYWDREMDRLACELLAGQDGDVLLRASSLARLHRAAARRLVRRAIQQAKGDLRRVDFDHVEAVLQLAHRRAGHGRLAIPGLEIIRSFDWLRLALPGGPVSPEYRFPIEIPGRCRPPGANYELCFEIYPAGEAEGTARSRSEAGTSLLDWVRVGGGLELRSWSPGDAYQPAGRSGKLKLKELFQRAQIPLWERAKWPIMTKGREIVWARRFGPAAEYAASAGAPVLLIYERGLNNQES